VSDFVNKSALLFVSPTSFPTQIIFSTTDSQTKCLLINRIVSLYQPQLWNAHARHNTMIITKYTHSMVHCLIAKYTEHPQLACITMQQSYPDRIAMPQTQFQKLTPQLCFVVLRTLQSVHSVHR
jgi:hypothetical protein